MKYLLLTLCFILVGCADQDSKDEVDYYKNQTEQLQTALYNCQDEKFQARMEANRLEAKLNTLGEQSENAKIKQHDARYKASNKNLQFSDFKSGARFLVDGDYSERIFLELPGNRYTFIIDDETKIQESTLMGIVNTKHRVLDYAKENNYGKAE